MSLLPRVQREEPLTGVVDEDVQAPIDLVGISDNLLQLLRRSSDVQGHRRGAGGDETGKTLRGIASARHYGFLSCSEDGCKSYHRTKADPTQRNSATCPLTLSLQDRDQVERLLTTSDALSQP